MADKKDKRYCKNGGIQLFASDKNHVFHYHGFCKIVINRVKSILFIEPINDEFKVISAIFKWKFCVRKNIFFVFADNKFHDIILVFNNEIRCKKVFDLIYRKRAFDEISNEIIYQHFLLPIFNNIAKNSNNTVSKVIKKWIDKLDAPDKESYTKMMKDDKVYHGIYPETESNEGNYDVRPRRKRKFSKVLSGGEQDDFIMDDVTEAKKKNEFIKSDYDFKMVNINGKRQLVKRLLLFPSADKRFCYVFRRNPFKPNILYCIGCRKMRTNVCAKIGENGELLLQAEKHVCSKVRFSAVNYTDLQIIRKPYYEILENTNTKTGKVLIIFNPNDLNQCHEFGWRNHEKLFLCFGCRAQAKINCASKENETVEVLKMNHECEYRQYDREKYFKFKNFVLSPDFELRTAVKDGIERKHLVIFDKNDKTKCFIYHFHSSAGFFKCFNCNKQKVNVSAKMLQNSEGENYIVLSNIQHICSSEKYFPQKNEGGVILRPPKIRFLEETSTGLPKLFIFDSDDKDLCYIFSPVTSAERNRYICRGCDEFAHKTSKKRTDKSNGAVYVRLSKNENGEYYIQMKDNQKHLCQPRRYEPEKYEITEPKIAENYFYYQRKIYPNSINVAILHQTESNLCYPFLFKKSNNYFYCLNCKQLKKYYHISPPKKDDNGKEYFIHDSTKHACEPMKIPTIQTSKFQKLERNNLTFKEKPETKEVKTEEKRIVKSPDFEFRPNQKGNPEGKLVIFDTNDNSLCYEYIYQNTRKSFVCVNCEKKKLYRVTAKVHIDEESNEKYIELSKVDHICEPLKEELRQKVINASNFMVVNGNDITKPTKIIVFTSEAKEFYYELCYNTADKFFKCFSCYSRKKYVGAKLYHKENGAEYLVTLRNEHICAPKKFDQKKFQKSKSVPDSLFELYQNTKGEANKRLVVFISEKKDLVYEYLWETTLFRCTQCRKQNKSVTAKLREENGGQYIELSKVEHICKPKKYDQKNYTK